MAAPQAPKDAEQEVCLTRIMPTPKRQFGREVVAEEVSAMNTRVRSKSSVSDRRDLKQKTMPEKGVVAGGHLSGLESKGWRGQGRN